MNRSLFAVLCIVAFALGLGFGSLIEPDDPKAPVASNGERTIDLPSLPPIEVDRDLQDEPDAATDAGTPELHEDAKDETPEGISRDRADDALVTPPGLGPGRAPAGAQAYRCNRDLVRNHSARAAGSRVSMLVLHFTVSRPGSLAAIRRLFDTPSFGASSTFGLELDGECEIWVAFSRKPWTQGAFNSVSESIEIVCCADRELTRAEWLRAPILQEGILAAILRDRARARGIPLRLVDPIGCSPKAGITDHDRLECQNSHWDVGRNFPWDVLLGQLRGPDPKTARSHRIVHAKLRKRCRGDRARSRGCQQLRARNRKIHRSEPSL
jgi:hypothetical protein